MQDPPQTWTPAQRPELAKARADFLAAVRNTFRSTDGARVLAWLHATAGTRRPAFVRRAAGQPFDPLAAALSDGRKAIVWEIESLLDAAESGTPDKPPASPRPRARKQNA